MSSADVDECSMGYHQRVCPGDAEICRNTVGSYECQCHHGYTRDHDANRCYGTTKALSTLATIVAEFGDCTENGDCRRIWRQSPFWATVAEFGDKLSPFLRQ